MRALVRAPRVRRPPPLRADGPLAARDAAEDKIRSGFLFFNKNFAIIFASLFPLSSSFLL